MNKNKWYIKMHKGIILLTKTNNKEDALEKIEEFLNYYKDSVWDWYTIGGRWSNLIENSCQRLDKCIANVKKYNKRDYKEKCREILRNANESKEKGDYDMYGFCLKQAGALFHQDFCDNCNIYNIYCENYSLPKENEYKDYYAVVVDIHF